jgi:hypothetical protein
MQRRTFFSTILAAAVPAVAVPAQPETPAEFKRRFQAESRRQGRPLVWLYQPGAEVEPFLDWYPGDRWVSRWMVAEGPPGTFADTNARAFEAEAQRHAKLFARDMGGPVLDWTLRISHAKPGCSCHLYL